MRLIVHLFLCFEIFHHQAWVEASTLVEEAAVKVALGNATTTAEEKAVKSVLMVCSTNECRSPIAAAIFRELVQRRGLGDKWRSDSAGIYVNSPEDRWPMDKRARATLRNHRIQNVSHVARMVEEKDFFDFDYMLGMDLANVEDLREKAPSGSRAKIELLSSYDPLGSKFIRHPFYDRDRKGFEECYKIAARSLEMFLDKHA